MDMGPRGSWSESSRAVRARLEARKPAAEILESRALMAALLPDVAMLSATTLDSRGVTIDYAIKNAPVSQPLTFGVYRSTDTTLDSTDTLAGTVVLNPGASGTLDSAGVSPLALGHHHVTLPLPGGLPINPARPNVLVVADPNHLLDEANTTDNLASFRKYTIGVITHGGKQPTSWKQGPPWQSQMAADLTAQGYDSVIPLNWVSESNHPGAAAKQGPRLAAKVEQVAAQFPAGAPVDVHFIGHSEGAVVNSEAINRLNTDGLPANLQAGYLKVTMLDPHAASTAVKGPQYSVSGGVLGHVAKFMIDDFQSRAKDPLPTITSNVQSAQVFFQHTPISQAQTNNGIYNLWGQVPVHGKAEYYNVSAPGLSHSGKFGVQDWYRLNVVPTLGDGAPLLNSIALTATQVPNPLTSNDARGTPVTYTGHAAPGATIRLLAAPPTARNLQSLAATDAGPDGSWMLTTRPLASGQYRVVVVSNVPEPIAGRPEFIKPTAWPGTLVINPSKPMT